MFKKNKRTLFISDSKRIVFAGSFRELKEEAKKFSNKEPLPLIEFRKDGPTPKEMQVGFSIGDEKFYAYQPVITPVV